MPRLVNSFSDSAALTEDGVSPGVAVARDTTIDDRDIDQRLLPDPFAAMPSVGRIAATYLLGIAAMVAVLTLIGYVITSTDAMSGLRDWDESISEEVAAGRTDDLVDLARFITKAGDTLPIVAMIVGVSVVLIVLRKWRAILFLPMAMGAEISTFLIVNHLVERERPSVEKIGPLPGTFSFPSGHVAATLVCWVGVSLLLLAYGWRKSALALGAFGVLAGVAMGWARVYVGMHHTIDVIFGFAMGVAALLLTVTVLRVDFRCSTTRAVSTTPAVTTVAA
jgi:undecaprenyl-diphosphatase